MLITGWLLININKEIIVGICWPLLTGKQNPKANACIVSGHTKVEREGPIISLIIMRIRIANHNL